MFGKRTFGSSAGSRETGAGAVPAREPETAYTQPGQPELSENSLKQPDKETKLSYKKLIKFI